MSFIYGNSLKTSATNDRQFFYLLLTAINVLTNPYAFVLLKRWISQTVI